ncbi:MAG: hypothetical protein ABIP33_05520 [Pseudolysinimonas sp.]
MSAAWATTGATDDKADDREQRDHTQDDHQRHRRAAEAGGRRVREMREVPRHSTQVLKLIHVNPHVIPPVGEAVCQLK